jgi:dTDP-4-amino-4,6-dideoxygalactose transaminase
MLVPALTFAATSNSALYENIPVEFVDIDPRTFLMDLNQVEDKLKKNPNDYQGVAPVDFAGYPVLMHELQKICDKYGLWTLEDACHAPGAEFADASGKTCKTGSGEYSDITVFSFHPVKHIACGEGGMITTNSQELYEKFMILRTHGITKNHADLKDKSQGGWYHEMQLLGFNYRMPDLNAALGLSQMKRVEKNFQRRQEIAKTYDEELKKFNLEIPYRAKDVKHAFHLYIVQTDQRRELYDFLKTKNIYSQVHYLPVYWHPYYQELGFKKGMCPVTEKYYSRCLSIPMYHGLTPDEQSYVIDSIGEFLTKQS